MGFRAKTRNYLDSKDVFREKLLMNIKVIFDKENPSRSGCWEWQKYLAGKGYGGFALYNRDYNAHVVSAYCYGLLKDINDNNTDDVQVLHKCNNKKCVNPSHLYIGTSKDNSRDTVMAGNKGRKS